MRLPTNKDELNIVVNAERLRGNEYGVNVRTNGQ
jgi:hypothetical protein